jgi:hypothetical protein
MYTRAHTQASVLGGKMPYYPKKGEIKRQELVAQYEELKKVWTNVWGYGV